MDLVSVIIPTYNRFKYLLNAINSVKNQTYENIELIVVNDCSTQKEYYEFNWKEYGVTMIHLKQNSKAKFGFTCAGYVRNKGIVETKGKYIAFCDDDDIWFPYKIELQLIAMKESECKMSSTDGFKGKGVYNSSKNYDIIYNIAHSHIWDLKFIKDWNPIICSSVIIEKEILNKINNMDNVINGQEDWGCWKKALKYTNSAYINIPLIYYDDNHGYGRNY